MTAKTWCSVVWIIVLFLIAIVIRENIRANYEFENKYSYAWSLADKSSTIESKCTYITEFVELINSNKDDFASHNAVWLKTKDNSFDYNLKAITTLKDRLSEIKGMNTSSFEYNTAIQQITAQEQGEAHALINTIKQCYVLQNHIIIWDWMGGTIACLIILLAVVGIIGLFIISDF